MKKTLNGYRKARLMFKKWSIELELEHMDMMRKIAEEEAKIAENRLRVIEEISKAMLATLTFGTDYETLVKKISDGTPDR